MRFRGSSNEATTDSSRISMALRMYSARLELGNNEFVRNETRSVKQFMNSFSALLHVYIFGLHTWTSNTDRATKASVIAPSKFSVLNINIKIHKINIEIYLIVTAILLETEKSSKFKDGFKWLSVFIGGIN
jgi:uncharacterized membrane protein